MMALVPEAAGSTDPYPSDDGGTHVDAPELRLFVMGLFFIFGGITSLNDVIIPKLKELFTLSFFEASLVQVWFFVAYAIVGIPGARLKSRRPRSAPKAEPAPKPKKPKPAADRKSTRLNSSH